MHLFPGIHHLILPFLFPSSLYPSFSLLTSSEALIYVKLIAVIVLHSLGRVSCLVLIDTLWSRDLNSVPGWAGFDTSRLFSSRLDFHVNWWLIVKLNGELVSFRHHLISHSFFIAWPPSNLMSTVATCIELIKVRILCKLSFPFWWGPLNYSPSLFYTSRGACTVLSIWFFGEPFSCLSQVHFDWTMLSNDCPPPTPAHSFTCYIGMYMIFPIPLISLMMIQDRILTWPASDRTDVFSTGHQGKDSESSLRLN